MTLCKVLGNVVSTVKHPHFVGHKLMICQPIDEQGRSVGASLLAVDRAQAGAGDTVLVLREGSGVRQVLGNPKACIRSIIIGIVDRVDTRPTVAAEG